MLTFDDSKLALEASNRSFAILVAEVRAAVQRSNFFIVAAASALIGLFLLVADLAEKMTDRRVALELILFAPLLLDWVLGRSADRSNPRRR